MAENVIGRNHFDFYSCPPNDDKKFDDKPCLDKDGVAKVRNDDLENMIPNIDLQFPVNVNVENFKVAIDAYCEENRD